MKKNVIVSLADSNYFPLLDELINSIKRFKESEKIKLMKLNLLNGILKFQITK